ncbi:MAG TPA: caspase family protein [Labilithrix sp.]
MKKLLASLACAGATFLASSAASAEPVRLLVSVGHKIGLAAEQPLKFADTDAARVRDVLVAMGGVTADHAVVLSEPSAAQLYAALDKLKAESAKHKPDEVTIIFYFSGHGDREAIHLGDQRVPITELSQRLTSIPAALRIVVTDACRSSREKGMTAEAAFPISLGQLPQANGSVWLNAASDGEAAQESDELQGAIFTHAWLNGLRGAADANGDGRVTLDEAFAFAHAQTLLRSAKSSGVLQKPEAIVSLTETAPVVLTQTAQKLAVVSLPPSRDTHYLVYATGAKSVLAEIWGSGERRTQLAVPPGRYVIHRRIGGAGGLAQIAIGQGEERDLEGPDFAPASLEALARKGSDPDADVVDAPPPPYRPKHELELGWEVGSSSRAPFLMGPTAGYAYVLGSHLALDFGGGLELSTVSGDPEKEKTVTPFARVALEPRWAIGRFTLRGAFGARAGIIFQTITRSDAPVLERGGYSGSTSTSAFSWGPEARAGVRWATAAETSRALFVDLEGGTNLALFDQAGSTKAIPVLTGMLGLGARF